MPIIAPKLHLLLHLRCLFKHGLTPICHQQCLTLSTRLNIFIKIMEMFHKAERRSLLFLATIHFYMPVSVHQKP